MRQLGISLRTRLSLVGALITCAVVVLAAPPAQADTITTVAGGGSPADGLGDGLTATQARLRTPSGVAATPDGGYLIAEQSGNRVRKVSADGKITTVAGGGSPADGVGDGGDATNARLNGVRGIEALPDGAFLVVEYFGHRIRHVSSTGVITTAAGNGVGGWSGDEDSATEESLYSPVAVAALPGGGFLIADSENHRIRKVDAAGAISTVAGTGTAGSSGDGQLATSAQINTPRGVEPTADGGFLISDSANHKIRKVDALDVITTVAGTGTGAISADGGQATDTPLGLPMGLEEEAGGAIVFGDHGSHRARRVDDSGVIRTVAGNGTAGFSGDNGEATSAQMSGAADVAVVPDGYLVVDIGNGRIRRVTLTDRDGDRVYDRDDNCPELATVDQADLDGDRTGDACDSDIDGDGTLNDDDKFPYDHREWADSDGDGVGDNGDRFPHDANESGDADNDGVGDRGDNCVTDANADQADADEDGIGDACDSTPRPMADAVCSLLTEYVTGSAEFVTLSAQKQAALRESLGNICASIERISTGLHPQQRAVLVRLQQLTVKSLSRDWLTTEQGEKLQRLIGNM